MDLAPTRGCAQFVAITIEPQLMGFYAGCDRDFDHDDQHSAPITIRRGDAEITFRVVVMT